MYSEKFQTWIQSRNHTLFCPGIVGAGKTILTSVVVEELTTRFSSHPTIGFAYIYCDYRRQNEQTIYDLLMSLLKQLSESQPSFPATVKNLYDKHITKRTRLSHNEIYESLQAVTMLYSQVYIIIDALDECRISSRQEFIASLFDLQTACSINLFITSRPIPSIEKVFEGVSKLEIRASEQDMRRYLNAHIYQLPGLDTRNLNLKEELETAIVKAVDGV